MISATVELIFSNALCVEEGGCEKFGGRWVSEKSSWRRAAGRRRNSPGWAVVAGIGTAADGAKLVPLGRVGVGATVGSKNSAVEVVPEWIVEVADPSCDGSGMTGVPFLLLMIVSGPPVERLAKAKG